MLGTPCGAGTRLHMGAVGMESSVQKMVHPTPLGWGSTPLPMAHLLLALTILTCRLCTCREGDLTPADRGDQSWLWHCSARRASYSPFSVCLAETSTQLPCPSLTRQGDSLSSLFGEVLSILSLEHVSKEIRTPAQTKPPPVLRIHTLAVLGYRWNRLTLSLQSKAESWEGSSPRSELLGHLGEVNIWDLQHRLTG